MKQKSVVIKQGGEIWRMRYDDDDQIIAERERYRQVKLLVTR